MHALWATLACFSGVFAFAYLLAGIMALQDEEPPTGGRQLLLQTVDVTGLSSAAAMLRAAARNWDEREDAQQLVVSGLICLSAFLVFVCLAQ